MLSGSGLGGVTGGVAFAELPVAPGVAVCSGERLCGLLVLGLLVAWAPARACVARYRLGFVPGALIVALRDLARGQFDVPARRVVFGRTPVWQDFLQALRPGVVREFAGLIAVRFLGWVVEPVAGVVSQARWVPFRPGVAVRQFLA